MGLQYPIYVGVRWDDDHVAEGKDGDYGISRGKDVGIFAMRCKLVSRVPTLYNKKRSLPRNGSNQYFRSRNNQSCLHHFDGPTE
jgi:hypothetical protein